MQNFYFKKNQKSFSFSYYYILLNKYELYFLHIFRDKFEIQFLKNHKQACIPYLMTNNICRLQKMFYHSTSIFPFDVSYISSISEDKMHFTRLIPRCGLRELLLRLPILSYSLSSYFRKEISHSP